MNIFNIPNRLKQLKFPIQVVIHIHADKYLWFFFTLIVITNFIIFWMVLYDIRLAKNYYRGMGVLQKGAAETLLKFPIEGH